MCVKNRKLPKRIRLDKELYCQPGRIYFVTIDTNFKKCLFTNESFNKEIIHVLINEKKDRYKIYVYCLMPDHLHFLISTNSAKFSVIDYVNRFKGLTTRIAWKYTKERVLWQRRFYDHIIRKEEDVKQISEYILNNPVRKNLVEEYTDYKYCGYLDEF